DLQHAIDLSAPHAGRDDLSAFRLERPQLVRQAETQVEKAVIDAAQLPGEPVRRSERLGAREACHAVWQGIESVPALRTVAGPSLSAGELGSGTCAARASHRHPGSPKSISRSIRRKFAIAGRTMRPASISSRQARAT